MGTANYLFLNYRIIETVYYWVIILFEFFVFSKCTSAAKFVWKYEDIFISFSRRCFHIFVFYMCRKSDPRNPPLFLNKLYEFAWNLFHDKWRFLLWVVDLSWADLYLGSCQLFMMDFFAEIISQKALL